MKVKELISLLEKLPQDAEVMRAFPDNQEGIDGYVLFDVNENMIIHKESVVSISKSKPRTCTEVKNIVVLDVML
jgi:hypothetical protein